MTDALDRALAEAEGLLDVDGVVSVGQGEDEGRPIIVVLVTSAEAGRRVPGRIGGIPVRVEDSGGPIRALGEDP